MVILVIWLAIWNPDFVVQFWKGKSHDKDDYLNTDLQQFQILKMIPYFEWSDLDHHSLRINCYGAEGFSAATLPPSFFLAFSAGVYIAAVTNKGTAYMFEFNGDPREGATPTASMENPKKK